MRTPHAPALLVPLALFLLAAPLARADVATPEGPVDAVVLREDPTPAPAQLGGALAGGVGAGLGAALGLGLAVLTQPVLVDAPWALFEPLVLLSSVGLPVGGAALGAFAATLPFGGWDGALLTGATAGAGVLGGGGAGAMFLGTGGLLAGLVAAEMNGGLSSGWNLFYPIVGMLGGGLLGGVGGGLVGAIGAGGVAGWQNADVE